MADEFDDFEDECQSEVKCQECGGTGLEWEGWDCWYCDGLGYLDF